MAGTTTGPDRCRHGMLEGNWVEEMALRETGSADDHSQTTFERVLGHLAYPSVKASTTSEVLAQSASLAKRTKDASYRYLKRERDHDRIWHQAIAIYNERGQREQDLQRDAVRRLQYRDHEQKQANIALPSDAISTRDPRFARGTTVYSFSSDIHCGRTHPGVGHERSTLFSQPIGEFVRAKAKE